MVQRSLMAGAAAGFAALSVTQAAVAAPYALAQRWTVGEAGRWDYAEVDPVRQRLFLSHGDRVEVLDMGSGKPLNAINGTSGVHGVALAQDLKLGFTSNGRANTVTAFDLETLQVKAQGKVSGTNPDAILYEPASHKLYTFNGKSADVTVMDAVSLKVLATMPVGGKPEFAVSDGSGKVYVNIEDKAEIVVLDVASDKVTAHYALAGCEEPTGLAMDVPHARLFSVCQNNVMAVTDARTGKRVASVPIGAHPDAAYYDAASATVFSSNGEGSLSVIHQADPDHYSAEQTVQTQKGARTMAFDPASKRVFLPLAADGKFTVLVLSR